VKSLLSARSRLHKAVLDALHNADIEIVSPSFMNQRPQPDGLKMIAKSPGPTKQEEASPEDVIFDKAEEAEQKEKSKETLMQTIADIDAKIAESDGENRDELKHQKATAEAQLAALVKTKNEEG
jgi:hypothetical protein